MAHTEAAPATGRLSGRKLRGDFPTPAALVAMVVDAVLPPIVAGARVRVLDPACGDGRFLVAAAAHIAAAGGVAVVRGVDVERGAASAARAALRNIPGGVEADIDVGDALSLDWGDSEFDVVLGNPPYLSQLASPTTRGGASTRGGGPYADVAAEFLALAIERAAPDGGRVGLVLPQSILGSRDVQHIRDEVGRRADLFWSWWSPVKHFEADVYVCALGFERRGAGSPNAGNSAPRQGDRGQVWTDVIVGALGVPLLPAAVSSGTTGERAVFTANFRDEYYGMIPAVGDHPSGPRLVTSGLIDPDRCWWGERPVRFNRRTFVAPRLDESTMSERMRAWARRLSVPKVLIANQTKVIECVVDRDGSMLPGVPVVTARPATPSGVGSDSAGLDALAAVLSSPFASAWAWHRVAGTGLSARTVRVGPALLADLPWPAGPLDHAIAALREGDLRASGLAVHDAFGIDGSCADDLVAWWDSWRPVVDRPATTGT